MATEIVSVGVVPEDRTVRGLIKALSAGGEAIGWVSLTVENGIKMDHQLRLHKTELLARLRRADPKTEALYYYTEQSWTNPYGQKKFERTVYVGRSA